MLQPFVVFQQFLEYDDSCSFNHRCRKVPKLEEMILEIEDLRSKMEAELREASRLRQVSRKISVLDPHWNCWNSPLNLIFWFGSFLEMLTNISWIWNCAVWGAVRILPFSFSADHLVYVLILWTIEKYLWYARYDSETREFWTNNRFYGRFI